MALVTAIHRYNLVLSITQALPQTYAPILHDDTQGTFNPLTHAPASALCPSQTDPIKHHLHS